MIHLIFQKMVLIGMACILILCLPYKNQSYGGILSDFETDASMHREKKEKPSNHDSDKKKKDKDEDKDSDSSSLNTTETIAMLLFGGLAYGGIASWMRINPSMDKKDDFKVTPRKTGEAVIPFLRTDISRQFIDKDLYVIDLKAEVGYGPFAIHYNQTHYDEKNPDDELDLVRIYGVYRMSFSRFVELDLGFGTLIIDGDKTNSGFSFTSPLTITPVPSFGVEFRPSWSDVNGTSIKDYDIAVRLGPKYIFFKAGYRWVQSVQESLNGPYAGVALYY